MQRVEQSSHPSARRDSIAAAGRSVASRPSDNHHHHHHDAPVHTAFAHSVASTSPMTPDPGLSHVSMQREALRPVKDKEPSENSSRVLGPRPTDAAPNGIAAARYAPDSQTSTMTSISEQVFTPPGSDTSTGGPADSLDSQGRSTQDSQLLHLSTLAAAQDKLSLADVMAGARKRMADGELKDVGRGLASPPKAHSRNTSAVSMASTTASTIGDLSADLKTRLSYAMVKVNRGWQSNTLNEVESLASQANSPTSSTSTANRRHRSSASPQLPMAASAAAQVHFAPDHVAQRRASISPTSTSSSKKPALAPPASIQPASALNGLGHDSNSRRNSNPRHTPTMLSHLQTSSSLPPSTHSPLPHPSRSPDSMAVSPHQNVREQDAIETLMFMRSPNNSANLKNSFSPAGSPAPPGAVGTPRSTPNRRALPSSPRRTLPTERPLNQHKKTGFEPMDLDSPQQTQQPQNQATARKRANGGSSHVRGALSLPTGLGTVGGPIRRTIRDEDIERMLDRAGAEIADSSDDEEIQLPRGRTGITGVGV